MLRSDKIKNILMRRTVIKCSTQGLAVIVLSSLNKYISNLTWAKSRQAVDPACNFWDTFKENTSYHVSPRTDGNNFDCYSLSVISSQSDEIVDIINAEDFILMLDSVNNCYAVKGVRHCGESVKQLLIEHGANSIRGYSCDEPDKLYYVDERGIVDEVSLTYDRAMYETMLNNCTLLELEPTGNHDNDTCALQVNKQKELFSVIGIDPTLDDIDTGAHINNNETPLSEIKATGIDNECDNEFGMMPFDKVLCRDSASDIWSCNLYDRKLTDTKIDASYNVSRTNALYNYKCIGHGLIGCYVECIPYKGNEHLHRTDLPYIK